MRNRLTHDAPTLFVTQYGHKVWARSLRELRGQSNGGRVAKMYRDKADGATVWVGYVIGADWFTAYRPAEVPDNG